MGMRITPRVNPGVDPRRWVVQRGEQRWFDTHAPRSAHSIPELDSMRSRGFASILDTQVKPVQVDPKVRSVEGAPPVTHILQRQPQLVRNGQRGAHVQPAVGLLSV